jgi:hypothetical protein
MSRPTPGPNMTPIQRVPGDLSLGVKRPGRKSDHSPASRAEVKNIWSYITTLLCVLMAWCVVKHRNKLSFTLLTLLTSSLSRKALRPAVTSKKPHSSPPFPNKSIFQILTLWYKMFSFRFVMYITHRKELYAMRYLCVKRSSFLFQKCHEVGFEIHTFSVIATIHS